MSESKYKLLPPVLKHCTVAIFRSGNVKGSEVSKWASAFLMACAQLTKLGYLTAGSEGGSINNIGFTGKISAASKNAHTSEGRQKTAFFDSRIWMLIQNETIRSIDKKDIMNKPQMDTNEKVMFDPESVKEQKKPSRQEKRIQEPRKRRK